MELPPTRARRSAGRIASKATAAATVTSADRLDHRGIIFRMLPVFAEYFLKNSGRDLPGSRPLS
jgi:hypothetical protein